ncbi:MAG: hypothetical protein O6946_00145 [Gammaproteobacteria bacterium]|nr:hypothetical protein [Gammaproteobacteria bacterium]
MDGIEQAKTVEDVRRAARKALSRLSRTFGEWETLISGLKADLSDQQSVTRELRGQIKHLPTNEQIEFLNGKIDGLKKTTKKHRTDRKTAEENRDDWKAESSRLQKDLKKKSREISQLERKARKAADATGIEFAGVDDAVKAELETEKTFSRAQAEQLSRLRKDLVEVRTVRQGLERKLDKLLSSQDRGDKDHDSFAESEKKFQGLRRELEEAREQLANQEKDGSAFEANEKLVQELRSGLEQAREQLANQETNSSEFEANEKEAKELRDELKLAREQLNKLSEMENAIQEADEKAGELRKKIDQLEFNNRALKKGTDLFLKEKAQSRTTISGLKENVEEMKVKVRMTEAHLAKARSGEASAGEDTLSMSAIQSRDIRFQVQNEELRVKLGNQRSDLDKLENAVKSAAKRSVEMEASNKAQNVLIEELQGDIDQHNRKRSENRKSDAQASQLKAQLEEKEKLVESLQSEILNQKSGSMDKARLDDRDETQTLKLNGDQLKADDSVAGKEQQLQIAELKGQLAKKELAMTAVQKSLADVRNRFHKLASKDRDDKTVAMPGPNAFRKDESSPAQSGADDQPDSSAEVAATVQIRRPKFD